MNVYDKHIMALWAKKEERASGFYWLPLMIHLTDTMNVSGWLWNSWLSDSQRQFCISSISPANEETALNLAKFLGAIHDLGKATPAFQIQKGFNNSPDLDKVLLEKLEISGFTGISSRLLADYQKTHHTIAGESLLKNKFHVKDDIGSIIGGHHGKPVDDKDMISLEHQSAYSAHYYQSEYENSDIYRKWETVHQSIFKWALEASGFRDVKELPEISQPAQVIYSGLLIMADWITSNRDLFPLIDIDSEDIPDCAERYRNGVAAWHKNLPIQIRSYPEKEIMFQDRFGFQARDFQKVVYETVSQIKDPGIIILEAPMGLGKTEAALAAAEIVAAKTGSSGLFFGLPTQATSNGMFGRVREWLEKLTKEYGEKQSLRLCHGKAALNEEMNDLKSVTLAQGVNIDEKSNENVFVNEWFSGRKKTSLDDFVVGTVDGFLLVALKQKHLALRHLGFSKKVVIIDEVHAYDTYMQQYLEEAIQWMGAYGTPVILVSATLPREKRECLIASYLKGIGKKKKEMLFPQEMSGSYYPLISYSEGTGIKAQTDFLPVKDKVIYVSKLSEDELYEKISVLMESGGIIGVIVNTVKKAQKLGEECKKRFGVGDVDILHSAFIATDRVNKESELIKMIGKNGNRPDKKIIIGTQVIEQSLDIDFDVLITDLCPMDLLLQRVGRLHRHDIIRPEKHKVPFVYVMGTNEQLKFESGTERIYEKYFLIQTQTHLPSEIRIPIDIPILIEKVYGIEEPEMTEEQKRIFQESRDRMEERKGSKSDKARTYRIKKPKLSIKPEENNLIAWLKNPDHSESEEAANAQVRDISQTIEIIAVKRIRTGYGTFDKEEDISEKINEPQIAKELAKHTIRLPDYVTMRNSIGKTIGFLENYNLEYLSEWQEQPWLKGSLGIIFDENGRFRLNEHLLKYDNEFGLREEKENGKV